MATHRYDPYLWVHLTGIATVPLWLAISGLGLAVGSPRWPGLELALVGLVGVLPVLGMQLWRPFYIFSLLTLKLKPTALSDDQRRLLSLFRQGWVRSLAVVAPLPLVWLLWEIYPRAVVAADITPFAPWGRLGGLAVAMGSFAMANLFLQVPVSVLAVMATSAQRFSRTQPYPLDQIQAHFTQAGIPLGQILPPALPPDAAVSSDQDQELSDLESQVSQGPQVTMDDAQMWADALQSPVDPPLAVTTVDPLDAPPFGVDASRGHSPLPEPVADPVPVAEPVTEPIPESIPHPISQVGLGEELGAELSGSESSDPRDAIDTEAEINTADTETAMASALDRVAESTEDLASHTPSSEDWDQTAHDWDQDVAWEASVEATKDRTIDAAVVRISDPS